MEYSTILAKQFDIKEEYAANIIALLDDGNTIPFIARYRKEMHGSMDDQLIRAFSEKLEYLRSLDKRREEIRALIEVQEKLTPEVSARSVPSAKRARLWQRNAAWSRWRWRC